MMVNEEWIDSIVSKSKYFKGLNFLGSDAWKTDPFINIGLGMGELFDKSREAGRSSRNQTLEDWLDNVERYNPGDERGAWVLHYFQKMTHKYKEIKWPYTQPDEPLPDPY